MSVEQLLQYVHPDAVYHRVPLPDEQNALGPWREAVQHSVLPDEDDPLWGRLIYGDWEGEGEVVKPVDFPAGPEGERLRALLDRNQEMLRLLEGGIARGRLQFPPIQYDEYNNLPSSFTMELVRPCGDVLWVKHKAQLADGDMAGTAKLLIQRLRMGEMLCNADGMVVDYLVGHGPRKQSVACIRSLASRDDVPNAVLRDLRSALETSLASPDGLIKCCQVELCCWDLPMIDRLPEGVELEAFVDQLIETQYQKQILDCSQDPPQCIPPPDDRLAWRRKQILALLEGHPCPLDKVATVRLMGEHTAALIRFLRDLSATRMRRRLALALQRRRDDFHPRRRWPRRMRYWPAQLTPSFPVDWLGPSDAARAEMESLREGMKEGFGPQWFAAWQPPTDEHIAIARRKLHRVRNPVGLMLAEKDSMRSATGDHFAFDHHSALKETISSLTKRLNNGCSSKDSHPST